MDAKQKLGHYEIQSRLGAGGMGEVYLARDTRLSRLVAIKTLLPSFANDVTRLKRFLQEAKVTSSLNHPNIGHLYEIGDADGIWYLALEYVDGPTVGTRLQSGPIPMPELLELAVQAADALTEAHAQGVLHRDLKPDNLMIDRRGQLKVLDFGLARADGRPGEESEETRTQMLTNPGVVMGTPRYMSPEQALGRPLDARSDLFSMGVVLYQMATGAVPFDGQTGPEITDAILHHTPTAPARLNPAIPPEFERILSRAMEKDPTLRYQSASDLRADLKRLKRDSESGQQATTPPPVPGKAKRIWIGLAVAAALVAVALISLWPRRAAPAESVAEMTVQSILNSQTSEVEPSLSPDGKSIAFAWNEDGGKNYDIYVKRIDAGNPLRLTTSPDNKYWPRFSPDGNYVAFMREKDNEMQLLIVPALGGVERVLVQWDAPREFKPRRAYGWHPDGRHIAYANFGAVGKPAGLMLLDVDSGTSTRLTNVQAGSLYDVSPVFFAGGSRLAFLRLLTGNTGTLEVLALPGQTIRSYPLKGTFGDFAVAPGEKEVLLSPSDGQLQRLRLDTGEASPSEPLLRNFRSPSFSADGRRMAYQESTNDTNIWHVALDRPGHAGPPAQWIASTYQDLDPRYSATGEQILFTSSRAGATHPWIADRQGRNPQKVAVNGPFYGSPNWSPDGGRIAYDARVDGAAQVMAVSALGGTPKQITTDKFENVVPSWSSDGQWIYYCSNRTGRQELWRVRPSGGASEQVTRNGGFDSQESRDGKFLYFSRSRTTPDLWRRTPDGQEELLLPEVGGRMWVAGKEGVYFMKDKDLMYLDLASRKISKVMTFTKPVTLASRGIDLSPDGRELLWRQTDSRSSDIGLVENFRLSSN